MHEVLNSEVMRSLLKMTKLIKVVSAAVAVRGSEGSEVVDV